MNEEIEIKLNNMQEKDKHHSIRINQDATVGDLINKIKESKEIVGNGQFLYLCCNNGGPNNGILSCKKSMSLKLSDFKINNDSELSFHVFDINNSYTNKVLAELLTGGSVVKIVQDGNIEIVFEKSIKYKLCLDRKFYSVLPMKLCDKIKDLITWGAHVAYYSYPIINDRDCVYFKINFGDKIITDPENTNQNGSLESMAIKQGSVLNIEITTRRDDQKVLTENGWVKAIDIIEQNKNKQQEEGNDESKEERIKQKETNLNLIDENPQQQKKNVKVNFNFLNQDKISNIKFNDNEIPVSNHENQKSSSNLWRILLFIVGVLSLAASLVVFLVNPELLALIIPLAVSGGISLLLVGFLWNTIKSCLCRQNPEEISTEQLTETNEYNPNKITDLSDLNNNLSLENNQKNENGQEKTDQ